MYFLSDYPAPIYSTFIHSEKSRSNEIRAKQVLEPIYSSLVSAWHPVLTQSFPHALDRARANAQMLTVLGYDAANYTAAADLPPLPDDQYAAIDENYEVRGVQSNEHLDETYMGM